jgi:hypothetical protein
VIRGFRQRSASDPRPAASARPRFPLFILGSLLQAAAAPDGESSSSSRNTRTFYLFNAIIVGILGWIAGSREGFLSVLAIGRWSQVWWYRGTLLGLGAIIPSSSSWSRSWWRQKSHSAVDWMSEILDQPRGPVRANSAARLSTTSLHLLSASSTLSASAIRT